MNVFIHRTLNGNGVRSLIFKKANWTVPNILTVLRIVAVPFFVWLLLQKDPTSRFIAFALFAAASITDLIDGYLARKYRQETELGKFLDPLADKALVLGAFITFLTMSAQVQIWMVLVIIGRDFLITSLRYLAIHKGRSLRTSVFGKIKTAFQMFCIVFIIFSFLIVSYRERGEINDIYARGVEAGVSIAEVATANFYAFYNGTSGHGLAFDLASFLPYYLMLATTIMTIISGLRYLITNYRLLLPPYTAGAEAHSSGEGSN
ncbi:MAG: CDP-diacylglycerol--glycerol-3-phosphate 3-phosphatidyltransferase [Leptospiraceae bacterium]|nr:CDP-diacylglycerol--glycerol-3-phosphate 3-phosphatidyltransferase [Leptospiraceae bacterium]